MNGLDYKTDNLYQKQSGLILLNLWTILCQDVCNIIMYLRHQCLVKIFKIIESVSPSLIKFYLSNEREIELNHIDYDRKIILYFCRQNNLTASTIQELKLRIIYERRCYNCNRWSNKMTKNYCPFNMNEIICDECDELLGCAHIYNCCQKDDLYIDEYS